MKLLLVDDHALFREGLRMLLANISPGIEIDEAESIPAAVANCQRTPYRMVLLDLGLSATAGLDTLAEFRAAVPEVPVVVLSGNHEPRVIRSAIEQGAVGFVPKSYTSELMINALQFVLAGGIYLPPRVLESDAGQVESVGRSVFERLSARQREIVDMLLQGAANKVIARRLDISEGTVKAHVSAIFQIIGARNRIDAVLIAARLGVKVI